MALFLIAFVRFIGMNLTVCSEKKGVMPMKHKTRLFGFYVIETLWAIGANTVANALPA